MHIDMNAFFAAVEQAMRPRLRGKPVLVAADPYGSPKGMRSVAATASYEARAYGLKAGMPLFEALRLCPHAIVIEGDRHKYASTSLRLLEILENYTDLVEFYSIDEAFIDVTHTAHLFGGKIEIAREIKRQVRKEFGITCSIGIAPNKLVAKIASNIEKPDGLVVFEEDNLPEALWSLPVTDIVGIGRQRGLKLNLMGIKTIRDLALFPRENLRSAFGVIGEDMRNAAWGRDDSPVVPASIFSNPKSVSVSSTLSKNTQNPENVLSALFYLAEKATVRLRKHGMRSRAVSVWVRYEDFSSEGKEKRLKEPIEQFEKVWYHASKILKKHYLPPKHPVRLVGVGLGGLIKVPFEECSILPEITKKDIIDDIIFATRKKYGTKAIFRARSMMGARC